MYIFIMCMCYLVENSVVCWTQYSSFTSMTSSNGNIFRITGPLCGEFTSHQWIPLTKASDEFWCFLWCAPHNRDLRHHHAHYDITVMSFPLYNLYLFPSLQPNVLFCVTVTVFTLLASVNATLAGKARSVLSLMMSAKSPTVTEMENVSTADVSVPLATVVEIVMKVGGIQLPYCTF